MGWTTTTKLVGSTADSTEENSCQNVWTWDDSRYQCLYNISLDFLTDFGISMYGCNGKFYDSSRTSESF